MERSNSSGGSVYVYIGTYSGGGSEGIYVFWLEPATGQLHDTGHRAQAQNASFLALHPNGRLMYAASEVDHVGDGPNAVLGGAVLAFAIDEASGALEFLNQRSSKGGAPCHVSIDPSGRLLAVANYGGGSVASLPIAEGGRLEEASAFFQHAGSGANRQRQSEPHAHSVTFDRSGRFALACDLGTDQIITYAVDAAQQRLEASQVLAASARPGAGPRHFDFHPSGRFGYAANELDSTVSAFAYDAKIGQLREIQHLSMLPAGFAGHSAAADVHVAPSGRFLYASNRGHDSLAIFAINQETGFLTAAGHQPTLGKTPRNFAISPDGAFLLAANQDSNSVAAFRIDAESGILQATGQSIAVPSPVCVRFLAHESRRRS